MAVASILDLRNSQILLAKGMQRVKMYHCAKFCQSTAELLQFFEMVAAAILDCRNS